MPLARHDLESCWNEREEVNVSTHMPLARHDSLNIINGYTRAVSTHMPLARHDENGVEVTEKEETFLLTCLLRGMTHRHYHAAVFRFVSTHMPLARHDGVDIYSYAKNEVSTHMPLARHDRRKSPDVP